MALHITSSSYLVVSQVEFSMAKIIHLVMSGWFMAVNVIMMNPCANVTNSTSKATNSTANETKSIAKMMNLIPKTCKMNLKMCGYRQLGQILLLLYVHLLH